MAAEAPKRSQSPASPSTPDVPLLKGGCKCDFCEKDGPCDCRRNQGASEMDIVEALRADARLMNEPVAQRAADELEKLRAALSAAQASLAGYKEGTAAGRAITAHNKP